MELKQHQPGESFQVTLHFEIDDIDQVTTYDIACEYFIHLEEHFQNNFPDPHVRGGPFPLPPGTAHTPLSSPLTSPEQLDPEPLAPALLITPPPAASREPRVPPPLPPRPAGHATNSLVPLFQQAFPMPTCPVPTIIIPAQIASVAMSDLFFSGDRNKKNELTTANFLKHLNILYRSSPAMTDTQKFTDVADRFEDQSAADKWFTGLKNTVPAPVTSTDWAAFSTVFIARFKAMGELAKGTVMVHDHQVYTLVDFIERLDNAITEAGATSKDIGLWDFHNMLPAVLQDGLGARSVDWVTMVMALKAILQTKIDAAVASFKDHEADRLCVDQLEKRFGAMQVAPQGARGAAAVHTAPSAHAVIDTSSAIVNEVTKGRRNKGTGANGEPIPLATNEQRDQLRKVLTDCVGCRHPNTPAGHRQDTMINHHGDWNHKKTMYLGE
ncbi:hypothetical protein B0H10DRAFT_2232200 [Mycena sp. CBHHK59/15]|nr:hypothetical protein B0H10DRAFT_2232200 [Mycena sp. CBHHK59/15]